jgi:hypothetical protein
MLSVFISYFSGGSMVPFILNGLELLEGQDFRSIRFAYSIDSGGPSNSIP